MKHEDAEQLVNEIVALAMWRNGSFHHVPFVYSKLL